MKIDFDDPFLFLAGLYIFSKLMDSDCDEDDSNDDYDYGKIDDDFD